jgi:hypothetical protein
LNRSNLDQLSRSARRRHYPSRLHMLQVVVVVVVEVV